MEAEGVDHSFKKFGRGSPGKKKGRELERVAESSRGFLDGKAESAGGKAEGPGAPKLRLPLDEPGPLVGGQGPRSSLRHPPEKGSEVQGCRRQKRAISRAGQEEGYEDSLGKRTEPCQPSGERPGAQGEGEGAGSAGREREKQEARPGIGKGPGGGSHADKLRDKLISSVYPGAGASSPVTLLPLLSLAPE